MSPSTEYDAIVIGGGHNGLVNGAYLAKAGLRTLILERRHLVGGAAITEELRPGFKFTTFSYALSLLRPNIIHELDLVKHGFMPLLMPSSFCPMENGDSLVMGQDRNENIKEIARHSQHDADAYDQYGHDIEMVVRAVKPLFDKVPPNLYDMSPEGLAEMAELATHLRGVEPKVLHDLVRLLTGSAADFLDDYFESDIIKGYLASSGIIGTKVGPMSQGSGLVLLFHGMGEHDGEFGSWAFHKGGNGGFTQVLGRAAQALGAEIKLNAEVDQVITSNGRAIGVALADGTELEAKVVVSAADPRRTFTKFVDQRELPADLVDNLRRYRYQGTSSKVNFALDGAAEVPVARRSQRHVPRLHQHRPLDGVPRAGVRRGEVRLVLDPPVHRRCDPVDDRPRHGAARQARDVVLHPLHAVPPQGQRLDDRARAHGRQRAEHARVVLPRLLRPRAAARDRDAARHRDGRRPAGGQHLPRRVPRTADVLLPAGAGLEPVPHADRRATTSAARARTPAAA